MVLAIIRQNLIAYNTVVQDLYSISLALWDITVSDNHRGALLLLSPIVHFTVDTFGVQSD